MISNKRVEIIKMRLNLLAIFVFPVFAAAFRPLPVTTGRLPTRRPAAVEVPAAARAVGADGLYAPDRYISTLRYLIPQDYQVEFEQTWAKLESSLGAARGFRYFQMSKRAADFMGPPLPDDEPNYMSYAVWDRKEDFEAFEEELDVMRASAGAAIADANGLGAAANYDGLFCLALPPSEGTFPRSEGGGWRAVDPAAHTEEGRLPREAFVASNRFGIKPGFEKDFEAMWARRDSSLADLPGFRNFALLRREGSADDGNTYVSYTTWADVQAFNHWRSSDNFKRSHSNSGGDNGESPYAKMPKVVTWKCFLCLSCAQGA